MTNDQLAADVAELKRQMGCVVKWFSSASGYNIGQCTRDLTTPPPKPRPPITAEGNSGGVFYIKCGSLYWNGTKWGFCIFYYSEVDARAIAAALEAAGNYPEEYKEKAR